jgi:hypothetical protein
MDGDELINLLDQIRGNQLRLAVLARDDAMPDGIQIQSRPLSRGQAVIFSRAPSWSPNISH